MFDLFWILAAFIAVFIAPGLALSYVLEMLSGNTLLRRSRLLSSYVFSFWLVFIPALLLARVGKLNQECVLLLLLFELTALFVLAALLRRRKLHSKSLAAKSLWRNRTPLVLLVLVLALVGLFHLSEILLSPAVRGGFFYFSEVKHLIAHQGIPEAVAHYGQLIVPQVDKVGFDLVTACYWLLGGGAEITPQNIVLLKKVAYLGTVLIGAAAAYQLFCLIASPLFGLVAALLLYANVYFGFWVALRSFFIPESTATALLFITFYYFLSLAYSKEKPDYESKETASSFWVLALASLALGATALQHLEIAFIGAVFITAFTLTQLCFKRRLSVLYSASLIALLAFIAFAGSYALLDQLPEFLRSSTSNSAYQPYQGFDPTFEYESLGAAHRSINQGAFYPEISSLLKSALFLQGKAFRSPLSLAFVLMVLFFLALLSLREAFSRRSASKALQPVLMVHITALLSTLFILLLAYCTDKHFNVWVYQTEVMRRLVPYLSLFLILLLVTGLKVVSDTKRFPGSNSSRSIAVGLLLLFNAAVYYVRSVPLQTPIPTAFAVSEDGLQALYWLQSKHKGSRVLSNTLTNGAFHVLADSKAVLEGHQPLLRPILLNKTLSRIAKVRSFFKRPLENRKLLQSWGVDYVALVKKKHSEFGGIVITAGENLVLFDTPLIRSFLCHEKDFGDISLYSVCEAQTAGKETGVLS